MTNRRLFIAAASLLIALGAVAAPPPPAGGEAKVQSFAIPGHGDLQLPVPAGWKAAWKPGDVPPTIEVTGPKEGAFAVLITPFPAPPGADPAKFVTPQRLRDAAEARGKEAMPTAKEEKLTVDELKGAAGIGYAFTVTDKAPDPGSFENMTGAIFGVGDLLLDVTILHHTKDAAERTAALDMLKGATQGKAAGGAAANPAGQPAAAADLRLRPPGANWELVLPGKGLQVVEDHTDDARKVRELTALGENGALVVSVFFEPAPQAGGSKVVRDVYWGRAKESPIKKEDVKLGEAGDDFATVQYDVPDVEGRPLHQRNVNLYASRDGVWVDVHLSKVDFKADKDQAAFDAIVKGARIERVKGAGK